MGDKSHAKSAFVRKVISRKKRLLKTLRTKANVACGKSILFQPYRLDAKVPQFVVALFPVGHESGLIHGFTRFFDVGFNPTFHVRMKNPRISWGFA